MRVQTTYTCAHPHWDALRQRLRVALRRTNTYSTNTSHLISICQIVARKRWHLMLRQTDACLDHGVTLRCSPTPYARGYMGTTQFNLRAVLMWTLHNFPAYGLLSGLTTKGFKACPVCGPHTISRRSKILQKNVYCNCHRRYLPQDHHFRGAHAAFDGVACPEMAEEPLTGNQTIRRGIDSEAYIDGGGTEKDAEFPGKEHGVKRVSALYQLSYWRVSGQTDCHVFCASLYVSEFSSILKQTKVIYSQIVAIVMHHATCRQHSSNCSSLSRQKSP